MSQTVENPFQITVDPKKPKVMAYLDKFMLKPMMIRDYFGRLVEIKKIRLMMDKEVNEIYGVCEDHHHDDAHHDDAHHDKKITDDSNHTLDHISENNKEVELTETIYDDFQDDAEITNNVKNSHSSSKKINREDAANNIGDGDL